jgi:predicted phosphodiesterase
LQGCRLSVTHPGKVNQPTPMRIAVFADIHGNLPAFEAALDHATGQSPDEIIIAGDMVVGAPDSAACWRLARSLGCPILRGNHERYVAHFGTPDTPPSWSTEQFAPVRWAHAELQEEERAAISGLPCTLRLPGAPDMLFVHASARSDHDTVALHTPEAELQAMFADASERFLIRGHNHVGQVRPWGDRLIVTSGAVGLPLDGNPTAQYLLLDRRGGQWQIQHQSVPYDLDAALGRFRDSGYLAATGPMGRLFMREVATASHQIVPFLRAYACWSEETPLPLAAAVERFLNQY